MFVQRMSPESRRNPHLEEHPAHGPKGRRARLQNAALIRSTGLSVAVVLIGGCALPHFRLRVAQGKLRGDLLPSYWSMAGVLLGGRHLFSIPIDRVDGRASIPETNGIQLFDIDDFDDTRLYPNIAVLGFPGDAAQLAAGIQRLQFERTRQSFPAVLWRWLGQAWGVSDARSPIDDGIGLPCAQFVAAAYAEAGVELQPGIAVGGACPETLWSTALWWHRSYRDEEQAALPLRGHYRLMQPAAAALGFRDCLQGNEIVSGSQQSPLAPGLSATPRRTGARRTR